MKSSLSSGQKVNKKIDDDDVCVWPMTLAQTYAHWPWDAPRPDKTSQHRSIF